MKSVTFVLCLLVLGAHSFLEYESDCEKYRPPNICMKFICEGSELPVGLPCPSVDTFNPCRIESDLTKPYPYCCPMFHC